MLRVWRRGSTIVEIPAGISHERVLRLMSLGTKEEAIENGWQRIALQRMMGEWVLAVDAKDLKTVQEAFRWTVKETNVMPDRVFHDAMMLEGKEVEVLYQHGRITPSDVAKWR